MKEKLEIGDLITSPDDHHYTVIEVDPMRVKLLFKDGVKIDWVGIAMLRHFVCNNNFKIYKAL